MIDPDEVPLPVTPPGLRRRSVLAAAWSAPVVALAVAAPSAAASGAVVVDEIVVQQLVPPNYGYVQFVVFLTGQNIPSQVTVHYETTDDPYLLAPSGDAVLQLDESGGGVLTLTGENLSGTAVIGTVVVSYAAQTSAPLQYDHPSADVPR